EMSLTIVVKGHSQGQIHWTTKVAMQPQRDVSPMIISLREQTLEVACLEMRTRKTRKSNLVIMILGHTAVEIGRRIATNSHPWRAKLPGFARTDRHHSRIFQRQLAAGEGGI